MVEVGDEGRRKNWVDWMRREDKGTRTKFNLLYATALLHSKFMTQIFFLSPANPFSFFNFILGYDLCATEVGRQQTYACMYFIYMRCDN